MEQGNWVLSLAGAILISTSTVFGTVPERYAPNEIIVKFREPIARSLEEQMELKRSAGVPNVSKSLDGLNEKYRLKEIKPLFKNFKKNRERLKALLKKDKALLTKKEKRILRRLNRAPKDAKVPDLSRIYKIKLDLAPGQSLQEVVQAYNNNPEVEYAELNYIVSIDLTPNDPLYSIQWPLNNTGQDYPASGTYDLPPGTPDCDIDAPEAWDIETGSSEVIVAVVDTGVDYSHRDLDDNMWVNEAELNGTPGVDDDSPPNGYIDDIYGYDFINNDSDPIDDRGHGTHCAGTIAAEGDNGLDITGVCWKAKIMALKFLGSDGYGDIDDAVAAFYYAVENGADVVSNSWGGGSYSQTAEEAIEYAYSQGVIMVAAAGNDNSSNPHYPAYYGRMFSVAATDSDDEKASFSNYGDWVDIAAPGVDVLSLRGSGTSLGTVYDDYTTIMSGTSMACPHVSGACATLLSIYPGLSVDEALDTLEDTADPIASGICGSGRVNLWNACLRLPRPEGMVWLDQQAYSCSAVVTIYLSDSDLSGAGSQQVTVTTDGADVETVVLVETSNPWFFAGTISTNTGAPIPGDGTLQVAHGHTITVTYEDANDGTGNPATAQDSAMVDCQPPMIFNVQIEVVGPEPTVSFDTDEPATGLVLCGLTCGGPYTIEGTDLSLATTHNIKIVGVSPETDYFFIVQATDAAGNEALDDNAGSCYAFTTDGPSDIYVPSQYSTIQAAIDQSWDGGIVWVADGTYTGLGNRDIDFEGKAVTVRSTNGPDNCIIDCETLGRAFYFHSGETVSSVLAGLTISNGYADEGGAIYCKYSSPTIIDCVFLDNTVEQSRFSRGGGLYCINSNLTLINCTFSGNTANDNGGGMYSDDGSNPTLTNCNFYGNTASGSYGAGSGGGMYCSESTIILTNCMFSGNLAWDQHGSPRALGGGLCCMQSNVTTTNCIFSGNYARTQGGGMLSGYWSNSTVTNCTFADNGAGSGAGLYNYGNSNTAVINCILWGNTGSQMGGPATVTYCDMQGGWTGEGNIDVDPCFVQLGRWDDGTWVDGDYHLQRGSPCINSGDPNGDYVGQIDIDGDPRVLDGRVDIGADEFDLETPIIQVSVTEFEFLLPVGGPNPEPQILSIHNCGGATLNWVITYDCQWLEVAPTSGTSTGEVDEVTLNVDAAALASGDYKCGLTISDPWALNSPQTIQVSLHVVPPVISVTPSVLAFQAQVDGDNPAARTLSISNATVGKLNWSITEDCPWLEVFPSSGECTDEVNEVTVSVDIAGLAAGDYNCELTISDPCALNSPQTVEVILHVVYAIIAVAPNNLEFHAEEGGTAPPDQILTISNGTVGTLNWTITADCPWLEVFPSSGQCTDEVNEVTVSVDITGLWVGTYSCELTISDPCAINNPQTAQVKLYVRGDLFVPGQYGTIQAAIDAATDGSTVIVGPDTYTGQGNRDLDFGGKAITVRSEDANNWDVVAATVIDCQYAGRGFYFHSSETGSSVLAGLTITNGYADLGGAVYCDGSSPIIRNCIFSGNIADYGGGMANQSCAPTVTRCIFTGNSADYAGGGMENYDCSLTVSNCIFAGNFAYADWGSGGGMENGNCSGTIVNCTFNGNSAELGGGINSYGSSGLAVSNCILWNDSAGQGPEIFGDASVSYSDVQGGYAGVGNIDADPCFVAGPLGDYYLSHVAVGQEVNSPCVDAGSDTAGNLGMDIYTTRTDEVGDEGIVDMGYHYPIPVPSPAGDLDGDLDVDFVDYALFAAGWYPGNSMTIPRGSVVVDGNLSEWSGNVEWVALDKIYYGSPNDVDEAWFALQWDADANKVYAAVIAYDGDHVFLDEYVSWDASDRLEVYSQGDAAGGTSWHGIYDVAQHYMVAPDTNGGSWATWALGQTLSGDEGLEYAVRVEGEQIIYEIGVRQFDNYSGFSAGDTIVTDLDVGSVVRFDVVADTRWSDGFGMLSENLMTGKYNDADQFATYMLAEEAGGPPCFERVADVDGNCIIDFYDLAIIADNWLWGL